MIPSAAGVLQRAQTEVTVQKAKKKEGWKEARHGQAFAWQVYDETVAGYRYFILPRLHAANL